MEKDLLVIILITIHNIDSLPEFYNFIEAIKSRSLDKIINDTNRYIIENLINLFERTRDVPGDYTLFESNLIQSFNEIKKKEGDLSNNSIIKQVGLKDN